MTGIESAAALRGDWLCSVARVVLVTNPPTQTCFVTVVSAQDTFPRFAPHVHPFAEYMK